MKIITAHSVNTDASDAISEIQQTLEGQLDNPPDWVLAFHTETLSSKVLAPSLVTGLGTSRIHGGTSCLGVMTGHGFHSKDGTGLGILAIIDPDGDYGVGATSMGEDPREAARIALDKALEDADRIGEMPALIWLNSAPGHEEAVIDGLTDLVGSSVPIAGGSTADNSVAGNWSQFAGSDVFQDAVVVSVMFPSVELSYAFHSGYDPTEHSGTVTGAEGRILKSIDGEPAATVYDRWTNGLIKEVLSEGGNVLASTTLAPLGREVGRVGGVPYYKLSHPDQITSDGSITLFTDITTGDDIILHAGTRSSLVSRAARVAKAAIKAGDLVPDQISGGLVIYCAGCMLTVQDDINQVTQGLGKALGGAPFLGLFTFGEQGCFVGNENAHGNLMISIVVFSDQPAE